MGMGPNRWGPIICKHTHKGERKFSVDGVGETYGFGTMEGESLLQLQHESSSLRGRRSLWSAGKSRRYSWSVVVGADSLSIHRQRQV